PGREPRTFTRTSRPRERTRPKKTSDQNETDAWATAGPGVRCACHVSGQARVGRGQPERLSERAVGVVGGLVGADQQLLLDHFAGAADRALDLGGNVGVLLQEFADIVATLADALRIEREPGARLFDHARLHAEVDDLAKLGDALAVHDVELDL